ncbi:ATP-dependent chaperone protein ClpB [Candidatus Magnetoovum chiemensis]|nr:ATP-dependent chaperone protein ClpB [Candidatus Magnetoovum chiemensis]
MQRIDMSEYQERHTVSRLIGAPPGYVGYEEGGQLTEAVRRRPYSVILFDEIEKAHPEVFNILLQMLDDGRLTDGHGRTVDFKNTIIIMTSNIGSVHIHEILEDNKLHPDAYWHKDNELNNKIMEDLRAYFKPEFLNRIDEFIIFNPLSINMIKEIVDIQLIRIGKYLKDKKITLTLTERAKEYVSQKGFDPAFGARPLKRVIQNEILNNLAVKLLDRSVSEENTIEVDYDNGNITFNKIAVAEIVS